MNIFHLLLVTVLLIVPLHAEFRTWTRADGNTARLELFGKSEEGEELKANFRMLSGKVVSFPVSALIESDADLVKAWKTEKDAESVSSISSVFDEVLNGNLVKLDGDSLKRYELESKPTKYYLFYYTASWCPPCQKFTPSLVKFYDKYKPKSNAFEIILVTSDGSDDAMEGYAASKKMNWPHLKLSTATRFKRKFEHPGKGIPNLVLTDLEGKLIKTSYVGDEYMGPTTVMNHLEDLIK